MKVGALNPSSSSAGMAATKSRPQAQKLTLMEGKQQPPFCVIERNVSQTVKKHALIFSCQQNELTQENRCSLRMLRTLQAGKKVAPQNSDCILFPDVPGEKAHDS